MQEPRNPRKPLLFYYVIVLLVMMLLNAFVFPLLMQPRTKEVSYDTFISMLENGQVKTVEVGDEQIAFLPADEEDRFIYTTVPMQDVMLTDRILDAGVEARRVLPKEMGFLAQFLLTWVLPTVLLFGLGYLLMRSMQKRMGGPNAMAFGKSNAKVYVAAETGKTFADVAGQEEAKEALAELVDFLHNPQKYREIGAQMPKGALLVGPPGTGKTLLAKAVAGEAGVPFFSISGSEFVEMFVGMGAARVRDLFKQAQEKAPCIVFIDEIDTIGKRRDSGMPGGNDEREQTLNQLLTEMDGFDSSKGVVILAATNRPETLDKALLRPGRFDRRIPVELPDLQGRQAVLQVHGRAVKLAPDVDFNAIALATAGASGAELANIVNEAALLAVKAGRQSVVQQDLEEAVETVIAGYQRKGAVISPREKRIIAYHEIGHALVAALQKHSAPVHKITIIPRTSGALGYTMQVAEEETVLTTRQEALDKLAVYAGGRAAEEVVFSLATSGAANDIEQATKLARSMVTRLGMSEQFGMVALETLQNQYLGGDASLACSPETAARIDDEVLRLMREAHQKATRLLEENRPLLEKLAAYLLEKETITGEEFMAILRADMPQNEGCTALGGDC